MQTAAAPARDVPSATDVEKTRPSSESGDGISEELEASSYDIDYEAERKLVRRLDLRIMPASMFIYTLCVLDRSNIGNAKVLNANTRDGLAQTLHISNQQYTDALMIFFVAYALFQTPSNYMLKKFHPSRWLAFLMMGWGGTTMILASVQDFSSLTGVRFLLGAFEAGLFPGFIYFFTFWYRPRERSLRIALIASCAGLGGGFGGSIAYGVGLLNHAKHLQGWRWLFLIEGAPACASAVFVYLLFPDYPETVGWLSPDERELAVSRIKGTASLGHAKISWEQTKSTLLDWRLYLHYLVYICESVPFSSISLFSPTIVAGLGFKGLDAQLFTVPMYAAAFVVTILVAWLSDRYEMWSWGSLISYVIAGISFIIQGALPATAFKARYGLLCIGASFTYACIPPLLTWLTVNLRGTSAIALAVALNVTLGTVGQIIGVYIYKSDEAPGYPTGHYTNAGFLLGGAAIIFLLNRVYARRNRFLRVGEKSWTP